jgi:serine/threonine protein kinase/tetratricopeptide (TPR) repeat protein
MIGKTISHYKILEKIGGGGMGVVYKAEDLKLRRTVALKFLPQDLTRNAVAKQRFIKEAQTASALDHPNISNIHEIDETDDEQLFISMTFYEGETLQKRIERGPLHVEQAITITLQVAQGLFKAHSKGIIHRDIKPGNIFITKDGEAKILDFGLAKLAGETRITKEGTTAGTIAYMSPEQARGEEVDETTDIWSLGVVLYEMVTGQLPFKGENWRVTLYSILNTQPESAKQLRADIPEALENTIEHMIKKDAKQRYQDTTTLITELCAIARESGFVLPQKVIQEQKAIRKTNKLLVPALVLVLVASALITFRHEFFPAGPPDKRKAIAVLAFKNQSGDNDLAYLSVAIPNLLITSLQETGQLEVVTWERMHDLARAAGNKVELIDEETGFEICRSQGIENIVLGSFTKAGDVFATDAKVLDVRTKKLLKSATSKGESIASIINNQIDELSYNISMGIGVSEKNLAQSQPRIAEVTTSSMEAYTHFLKGRDYYDKWYATDARRHFEAAIELDSTFATAYLYLSWTLSGLRDESASNQALERAREFSHKATERESLYIEAYYGNIIEANWEKFMRVLNLMAQKYPNDKRIYSDQGDFYRGARLYDDAINAFSKSLALDADYGTALTGMAYTYAEMGAFSKALGYFQRYQSLHPADANTFDTMADIYLYMGEPDKAIASYKKALEIRPDFVMSAMKLSYVYGLKEKYDDALQWCDHFITHAPTPGRRGSAHMMKAFFNYWLGNLVEWEHNYQQTVQLFEAVGFKMAVYTMEGLKGALYYELGDLERSRSCIQIMLDSINVSGWPHATWVTAYSNCCLALIDLEKRNYQSCRSRLALVKRLIPKIEQIPEQVEFRHDLLYAELLLTQDSLEKAIEIYHERMPVGSPELNQVSFGANNMFLNSDVLARVYVRKGKIDKAIKEYEHLVTFEPKQGEWLLISPKYHYRLAQLYEKKGRYKQAITEYDKFINILEKSDVYVNDVTAARERLAALKK